MRQIEESRLLAQHPFCPLSVFDVDRRSVPFDDVSPLAQRHGAQHGPAVLPVSPAQPCFLLERLSSRPGCAPLVHRAVFGMECIHPAPALSLLQRQARILPETLIEEIGGAVGQLLQTTAGIVSMTSRSCSLRLRARLTRPVTINEVIKNEITTTASSEYWILKLKTGAAKK